MYGKASKKKPSYFKAPKMSKDYKAKKITMQPKRVTVEKKNRDGAITAGVLPAAGVWSSVNLLNPVAQGVTTLSRIGREIQMKSLKINYETASGTSTIPVRMLAVYDKQTNGIYPYYCGPPLLTIIGALPSITDILSTDAFTSQANLDNKDRFVTLMDVIIKPGGSTTVDEQWRKFDLPVVFKGTGGAITDISTGGVYFMVASASALAAPATYNAYTRIRYTDC